MTVWVALLRSVNASSGPRFSMAELRAAAQALGWTAVRTHLQTGNVVFEADDRDGDALADALSAQLADRFGATHPGLALPATEFADIVAGNPFAAGAREDPRKVTGFVLRGPLAGVAARVSRALEQESGRGGSTDARLVGRALWLHTPDGFGRDRTGAGFTRPGGLGPDVLATARNARTLASLVQLSSPAG